MYLLHPATEEEAHRQRHCSHRVPGGKHTICTRHDPVQLPTCVYCGAGGECLHRQCHLQGWFSGMAKPITNHNDIKTIYQLWTVSTWGISGGSSGSCWVCVSACVCVWGGGCCIWSMTLLHAMNAQLDLGLQSVEVRSKPQAHHVPWVVCDLAYTLPLGLELP